MKFEMKLDTEGDVSPDYDRYIIHAHHDGRDWYALFSLPKNATPNVAMAAFFDASAALSSRHVVDYLNGVISNEEAASRAKADYECLSLNHTF